MEEGRDFAALFRNLAGLLWVLFADRDAFAPALRCPARLLRSPHRRRCHPRRPGLPSKGLWRPEWDIC